MKIAIIGAGMAGLTCADRLAGSGHLITLFEKSRGASGRMATRRVKTGSGEVAFDHGCQYFTAVSPAFVSQVQDWSRLGLVARWPDAESQAWVGVPAMSTILRHVASRHEVILGCHVRMLSRREDGWHILSDGRTDGPFDAAIVATPAEQAAPILSLHDFDMARVAASVSSSPCWTLMLAFASPLKAPPVHRGTQTIGWAARNNSKPGRPQGECWVIQASPEWSALHLELPAEEVETALFEAFEKLCGPLPDVIGTSLHRWRYAHAAGTDRAMLWNAELRLGACGDWLSGHRVECAWTSGMVLAEAVVAAHGAGRTAATVGRS
jgi:predicted NAD/FAD-dependent oxidoreductase